jgi:hypothetical protein
MTPRLAAPIPAGIAEESWSGLARAWYSSPLDPEARARPQGRKPQDRERRPK